MFTQAVFRYFKEINTYNVPLAIIIGIAAGPLYALLIFSSFGIFTGMLAFDYFKKHQYYMYENLGFSKSFLLSRVFLLNILISVICGIILLLFWEFFKPEIFTKPMQIKFWMIWIFNAIEVKLSESSVGMVLANLHF